MRTSVPSSASWGGQAVRMIGSLLACKDGACEAGSGLSGGTVLAVAGPVWNNLKFLLGYGKSGYNKQFRPIASIFIAQRAGLFFSI